LIKKKVEKNLKIPTSVGDMSPNKSKFNVENGSFFWTEIYESNI